MKQTIPLYQVDAFTDQLFRGNPAAVCPLDTPRDAAWMQAMAAEMNLSESTFIRQTGSGYELRWFTPTTELDLCGHATLAAAHVLWEQKLTSLDTRPVSIPAAVCSPRATQKKESNSNFQQFPPAPPRRLMISCRIGSDPGRGVAQQRITQPGKNRAELNRHISYIPYRLHAPLRGTERNLMPQLSCLKLTSANSGVRRC